MSRGGREREIKMEGGGKRRGEERRGRRGRERRGRGRRETKQTEEVQGGTKGSTEQWQHNFMSVSTDHVVVLVFGLEHLSNVLQIVPVC